MADQYMIQRLKYISEESIISANQINLQNVCFLLNFSTIQTALVLRKRCLEFMMKNYSEIIVQDSFIEGLDRQLIKEVMHYANRNIKFEFDNYDFQNYC